MNGATRERLDGWSWAIFFVRWVLGLIFFMAGWWKTFDLGPVAHAWRLFVVPYADSWIPAWLLWSFGTVIPVVELIAGAMMCLGLRVRWASIALGGILVVVAYGHLLREALFDTTHHIFPRLVLLTFVLAAPPERDLLSLDAWLRRRRPTAGPSPA
jgi:thiosulfate dehydrogenase (quinone) large subunit